MTTQTILTAEMAQDAAVRLELEQRANSRLGFGCVPIETTNALRAIGNGEMIVLPATIAKISTKSSNEDVPVLAAAIALLVVGGFVSDEKVSEAIQIAINSQGTADHAPHAPMVDRTTAPFFALIRQWGVYVKEGDFFRMRGGLKHEWGKDWTPIYADSIERAREIAKTMQ